MPKRTQRKKQRDKQRQLINEMWREFQFDLVPYDRSLIAAWVTAMRYSCLHNGHEEDPGDYLKVAELYRDKMEELWAPLLLEFLLWVIDTVDSSQTLIFPYRDAWLLDELRYRASTLRHQVPRILPIYLNRPLLGVEDEYGRIKCESTISDTELYRYLAQLQDLADGEGVLVDIGQWGTMLPRMFNLPGLRKRFQSRFFFSWNPWIPGFTAYRGLPQEVGVALADSIELLPKLHRTPTRLRLTASSSRAKTQQGLFLEPVREETGVISRAIYLELYQGLHASWERGDASRLLTKAWSWHIDAAYPQGAVDPWNSVLRQGIPCWGGGQEFLRTYPDELRKINPPELCVARPEDAKYRVRRPSNIARVPSINSRKKTRKPPRK